MASSRIAAKLSSFFNLLTFHDVKFFCFILGLSFYVPGKDFTCLDGSVTVPFSYVNDDYCDCPDGSDEPGSYFMALIILQLNSILCIIHPLYKLFIAVKLTEHNREEMHIPWKLSIRYI